MHFSLPSPRTPWAPEIFPAQAVQCWAVREGAGKTSGTLCYLECKTTFFKMKIFRVGISDWSGLLLYVKNVQCSLEILDHFKPLFLCVETTMKKAVPEIEHMEDGRKRK